MSVAVESTTLRISTNMAKIWQKLSWNYLQNKEKGGLGVVREHGHNEDEDQANEDPGVNSDNEEDDEFKVMPNL